MYHFMIIFSCEVKKMIKEKKLNLIKLFGIVVSGLNLIFFALMALNKHEDTKDKRRVAEEGHAPLDEK